MKILNRLWKCCRLCLCAIQSIVLKIWQMPFVRAVRAKVVDAFEHPAGRPAKKVIITVAGVAVTLIGILLIVLPGPAFLLIPVGLGILAVEYPFARRWLRKFQGWLTLWATKADALVERFKAKRAR